MTTPTVIELPPTLAAVTPPTFVFTAIREGAPRPATFAPRPSRRIVD